MSDSSRPAALEYTCPKCQARLTADPSQAGERRECAQCGKMIKVPGSAGRSAAGDPASVDRDLAEPPKVAGPAAKRSQPAPGSTVIPVVCKTCGTRQHATLAQVGQSIVCPDCLESSIIQAPASLAAAARRTAADDDDEEDRPDELGFREIDDGPWRDTDAPARRGGRSPTEIQMEIPAEGEGEDDGNEYELSEPFDRPDVYPAVRRDLADLDRPAGPRPRPGEPRRDVPDNVVDDDPYRLAEPEPRATTDDRLPGGAEVTSEGVGESGEKPVQPRPRLRQFAVKCEVCNTRVHVTEAEIGQTKQCPDCFAEFVILAPPPERIKEAPVEKDEDPFQLIDAEQRNVYTQLYEEKKSEGADVMDKAATEWERRKEEETPVPPNPLVTGVFDFLKDVSGIAWLCAIGTIIFGFILILVTGVAAFSEPGAMAMFKGVICVVISGFIALVGGTTAAVACLAVLQDSANGESKIQGWPGLDFMDWAPDSLFVVVGLVYAATPGMVVYWPLTCMGVPPMIAFLPVMISVLALFPVFVLSMLEGSSLLSFYSPTILSTVTRYPRPWATFYAGAFIIGVLLVLSDAPRWFGAPMIAHAAVIAALWALGAVLYFRLLGRLAWWLQDLTSINVQPKPKPTDA